MKPRSSKTLDRALAKVANVRTMYDYPWPVPVSVDNLRSSVEMLLVIKAFYTDWLRMIDRMDTDIAEREITRMLMSDLGARLQAYWELDIDSLESRPAATKEQGT